MFSCRLLTAQLCSSNTFRAHYAFPPLFFVSLAGVPLGIARSALDFVEDLCVRKPSSMPGFKLLRDDPSIQETISSCEAQLSAARAYVYATLEDLWATLCAGDKPSPKQRAQFRMMITYSNDSAKWIIQVLDDAASTSSIFRSGRLDRDMRDIMTACQHRVAHLKMYRPAGRLLLGLESEEMLF